MIKYAFKKYCIDNVEPDLASASVDGKCKLINYY